MRISAALHTAINTALQEKISSTTQPTAWRDIVEHINGKGVKIDNWLVVRAVLQNNPAYKRIPSVHREEYVRVK